MDFYLQHPVNEPFLLNGLKHHAGYVKNLIFNLINKGESILPSLPGILKCLGGSQMDLYTGLLTPDEITGEIEKLLKESDRYKKLKYLSWIEKNNGYQTLPLSDKSVWVLMEGNIPERYIHIHPGRHSLQTVRLRSGTLKSAIAVNVWAGIYGKPALNLRVVNEAREALLNESPVKHISQESGLGAAIKRLNPGC